MTAVDLPVAPSFIADWRSYPSSVDLVGLHPADDRLDLLWRDGRISPFHHQWLRDNCACSRCVYDVTREQLLEIVDVPETLLPLADTCGIVAPWLLDPAQVVAL